MSAAATAAGYLYASGRLRGRAAREQQEDHQAHPEHREQQEQQPRRAQTAPPKEKIRVAVYPKEEKPRRTPKIEYRTRRRWTPE